jgi:ketosteroid isomerase-like protein
VTREAEAAEPTTERTRALVTELFAAYERGDSEPLFERVADDVRWTVMGTHPLAGEYRSKAEFRAATYGRLHHVLDGPITCTVTRILADGEMAVVEWRGRATSVDGRPFNNVYCWVLRVVEGRIIEVTAYVDSALVADLFARTHAP